MCVMDEGQIAAFQRDGYLLLPGFFDRDEVAEITRWTEELASAPEEVGRHWVYREASLLVGCEMAFGHDHPGADTTDLVVAAPHRRIGREAHCVCHPSFLPKRRFARLLQSRREGWIGGRRLSTARHAQGGEIA